MHRLFLFISLALFPIPGSASEVSQTRSELIRLMTDRAGQFRKYTESLQRKSGIFGQRTKTDLKDSHDRLAAIVETDNGIIRLLDRMLEQRTFERVTMTCDASRDAERIRNLQAVADTMTARATRFEAELDKRQVDGNKASGWTWIFGLIAIAEGLILYYQRKKPAAGGA